MMMYKNVEVENVARKMANVNCSMSQLKFQTDECFKILHQYSWLLDAYILDFFTENHVNMLPKSWKTCMEEIPLKEFQYLLNFSSNVSTCVWPLSVMCLKVLVKNLSFPREIKEKEKALLFQSNKLDFKLDDFPRTFNQPKLNNLFLKHVKPKKRYEIFKLAEITSEKARTSEVNFVVDVGSGLGHFSRILAYGFGLKVCSIETQSQLIAQAEKLDLEFEKLAEKYLGSDEIKRVRERRPVRWNKTIKFDIDPDDFFLNLKSILGESKEKVKFGIVGLHPCGDLATLLLRLYISCPEARFISLVGCCYHKLSTFQSAKSNTGFPVSIFCNKNKMELSYEARALGCHAIENYCERLRSQVDDHLKIHCYRAALERIIQKNWPEHRKQPLANVKANPGLNFEKYCNMALNKLNIKVSEEDWNCNEISQNLLHWQDVAKFYTFRLMLAPLIETLILLDRQLYLVEKEISCEILAAFDPEVSPRNLLLISEKS